MRRAGDVVLGVTHAWGEKPRDEVDTSELRTRRHDDTPRLDRAQERQVRRELLERRLGAKLDQVVQSPALDVRRRHPQRVQKRARRLGGRRRDGWEVELDQPSNATRLQL